MPASRQPKKLTAPATASRRKCSIFLQKLQPARNHLAANQSNPPAWWQPRNTRPSDARRFPQAPRRHFPRTSNSSVRRPKSTKLRATQHTLCHSVTSTVPAWQSSHATKNHHQVKISRSIQNPNTEHHRRSKQSPAARATHVAKVPQLARGPTVVSDQCEGKKIRQMHRI